MRFLGSQVGLEIHLGLVSVRILLLLAAVVIIVALVVVVLVLVVVVALANAWGKWIESTATTTVVVLIVGLGRLVEGTLEEVRNGQLTLLSCLRRRFSLLKCVPLHWSRI